jgi:hypothetical protein
MRRTALLGLAGLLFAGITLGEDFWARKDYTQWTDEEVRRIMTNSPWSKEVTVDAPAEAVGGGRRSDPASAAPVNVENSGGGRGGRGGGRAGGDAANTPTVAQITLTVSWRSALPLRRAVVKSRIGASSEVPADLRQSLSQESADYVVVVSGVPASMARTIQDPIRLNRSTLKIGKRVPVVPKGVDFQTRTQSVDVFFVFPKNEPITLDDKEVELDLLLGRMEARRKFTLKDMVYNGKLEM